MHAPTKTYSRLAATPLVSLGDYACGLGHRAWGGEACSGHQVINLHSRGTYAKQVGGRELFVEPGSVVFYPRGEEYRTSHPLGCSDGGRWISIREDALAQACAASDPAASERASSPWRAHALAPDPRATLAIEALFARAAELAGDAAARSRRDEALALELEERALALASTLARRALVESGRRAERTRDDVRRARARRALADALRTRLVRRLAEPCGLAALARELESSPFALCRAFRAETGTTMSAWRRRVRLQRALERVLGSREELLSIALELGFASHSHLTREFRAHFGVTPSALRRELRTRRGAADDLGRRATDDPRTTTDDGRGARGA